MSSNQSANYVAIAEKAFTALESATRNETTGTQSLAYAVMCLHADAIASGKKMVMEGGQSATFPALSTVAASKEATKALLDECLAVFMPEGRPKQGKGEHSESVLHAIKHYNARYAALRSAITLASDLQSAGIDRSFYLHSETKNGVSASCFGVLPSVLLLPGDEATGKIAKEAAVKLDGKSWFVQRGDAMVSINASVAQVMKVAKAKREALIIKSGAADRVAAHSANKTATTGGATADEMQQAVSTHSFEALARELAKTIKSWDDDGPVPLEAFDTATRNALADINRFYMQCQRLQENVKKAA